MPARTKRPATAPAIGRAGDVREQVHHGDGIASWAVSERALARGHGIRTGLEDTTVLPDGRQRRAGPHGGGAGGARRPARPLRLRVGHRGDRWLELDALFLDARRTDRFAIALAERLAPLELEPVCGPLVGGALLAQPVAAHLGVDLLYAEQPGYRIPGAVRSHAAGRRFAIVDDVVNAGSATRATHAELLDAGARPAAIAGC